MMYALPFGGVSGEKPQLLNNTSNNKNLIDLKITFCTSSLFLCIARRGTSHAGDLFVSVQQV